jgi:hypothetical protein
VCRFEPAGFLCVLPGLAGQPQLFPNKSWIFESSAIAIL